MVALSSSRIPHLLKTKDQQKKGFISPFFSQRKLQDYISLDGLGPVSIRNQSLGPGVGTQL